MTNIEEERETIINLIEWYRDKYHKQDFGHNEMIEKVKTATNLEIYWQVLDLWIQNR